jgi:hypothetical protein
MRKRHQSPDMVAKRPAGQRRPTVYDTICPARGCGGTLYNVTSRLAMGLGLFHLRCDRCNDGWGIKVGPEEPLPCAVSVTTVPVVRCEHPDGE